MRRLFFRQFFSATHNKASKAGHSDQYSTDRKNYDRCELSDSHAMGGQISSCGSRFTYWYLGDSKDTSLTINQSNH
jgi:hypothetical protein